MTTLSMANRKPQSRTTRPIAAETKRQPRHPSFEFGRFDGPYHHLIELQLFLARG